MGVPNPGHNVMLTYACPNIINTDLKLSHINFPHNISLGQAKLIYSLLSLPMHMAFGEFNNHFIFMWHHVAS